MLSFALIFAALTGFTVFGKKDSVSYNENRVLAVMPQVSFSGYLDESLMAGISDYVSDHFAFRDSFVMLKNKCERLCGKDEISGVCTRDGRMIQIFRNPDSELAGRNCAAVEALAKRSGIPVYFSLVPTAQEVYNETLPPFLRRTSESEYIADCFNKVKTAQAVDFTAALKSSKGEYIYYRTDHHWTSAGAFIAYGLLGSKLGYESFTRDMFNVEFVTDSFRGTLFSKTLDKSVTPDTIGRFTLKTGEPDIVLTYKGENGSMYYPDKLNEKDKYAYFLGNNKGVLQFDNASVEGGSLLVVKDSYANCLLPLLARHYSHITVVDPRYASINELAEINLNSYGGVLVLYNVIGFSEEDSVTKINFIGK